ncbi:hypothetical protein PsorP6_019446 [Peronosclerospora sorghi]|nr:hypothetical protein PsorP6_019446 [Peronosclerospora sorghi]
MNTMALRSLMFALFLAITFAVAYTERTACCGAGIPTSPRYALEKVFQLLKTKGHEKLSFITGDDKTEKTRELERFGERMDENLVLFTPETALGSLRKSDLLHFVESGGHVLLSASKRLLKCSAISPSSVASSMIKKGTIGLDHVNPITDDHDISNLILAAKDFVASDRGVGSLATVPKPVAFFLV